MGVINATGAVRDTTELAVPGTLSTTQISFFVILTVAFGLLLTERIRGDVVALLIVLSLAISGVLTPAEALAGFGSEPAIIVASILVLSAAVHRTGLDDTIGSRMARLAGSGYSRIVAVIMTTIALLSSFTHHVATTAVMLPVTMTLARERQIAPSKLLIPLSFAASLGTTILIIGAPAFLVASNVLKRGGRPGLSIASIAPIGLSLLLVGTLFMVLFGRVLLPNREGAAEVGGRFRLDNYFTELTILPSARFAGKTLAEVKAGGRFQFTVVGWVRDGQHLPAPFARRQLVAGDVLLVRTTPEDIVAFGRERGVELHPVEKFASTGSVAAAGEEAADSFVQAVVAPQADIIGQTLREIDFRRRFGPIVVGLWRQEGFLVQELARIQLRAGDVLVLQGTPEQLARVERDRAFLLLVPFHGEAQQRRKAPIAGGIMLCTVLLAAFGLLSLDIAMLLGAVTAVATGCLTPRQAYRAIDTRIYVFIAGVIPLGAAMEKTGAAALLAGLFQNAVSGWSERFILLAIFAIVAVITQFMSDAGTTALFAPIALALATSLGHAPEAFVVTVAMSAVASFLTPIGHHGNLLIYGPGGYQFMDFLRVGGPLTVLIGLVVVLLAPMLWPG